MTGAASHRDQKDLSFRAFTRQLLLGTALCLSATPHALAQIAPDQTAAGTNRPLQLAEDSPYRDPDIIYLEADELINDEAADTLSAIGQVEGRYQDRTLRADRVDYNVETGQVIATGNVVLIDATGDVQFADKLELSDELQAGTAANFTARLASGATTAARFVTRSETGEFELFNATYTACEICENSEKSDRPTWRLRARRVRQNEATRNVEYRDAVIELFGLPIFYTPYLAHPDPSQDRASGLLTPTVGLSGARGGQLVLPYYWAIDDHTEATITPRLYTKVNPLLQLQARRRFYTGELNFEGSMAYDTAFDRNGNSLDDPTRFANPNDAENGDELSSHFFLDGYFRPSGEWSYGYTVMLQTDDNYLDRYGLSNRFATNGLVENENRRNTTQAFIAGQGDNFRVSALAVGFQDLNSRFIENDTTGLISLFRDENDRLPIIAPKVSGEYYIDEPFSNGRVKLFGDATYLTRDIGSDYGRSSVGAEYSKTFIIPGGLEAKPFAWGRFDQFDLETDGGTDISFGRTLGQAGLDLRYPFIKKGGSVDWIVEPRILFAESFGNAKLDQFVDPVTGDALFEDGISPDLDTALIFEPNKADGYDFFQEGRRVDVGATVEARWKLAQHDSRLAVFAGQSYADDVDANFAAASGLSDDSSDYVGEIDFNIGRLFQSNTRLRYDDERNVFARVDTTATINTEYVSLSGRYFTLNTPPAVITAIPGVPPEEVSGRVTIRPLKNWSISGSLVRDLDQGTTRNRRLSIAYRDDCTLVELFVTEQNFNNDLIRNDQSFGLRITLSTLGSIGSN